MAHQPKGDIERLAALIEAKLADLESRTRAGDLPAHRSSENEAACLLDAYLDAQREHAEEAARAVGATPTGARTGAQFANRG